MRVLIDAPEPESKRLASIVRGAGHQVLATPDEASLDAALDLALVYADDASEGLLARLRSVSSSPSHPHTFLLHSGLGEDFLSRAFEAGVDEDLDGVRSDQYFVRRLAALQRRRHPHLAVEARGTATAPSAIDLVARSTVWGDVLQRLEGAAARFLTMNVSRVDLPAEFVPEGLAASIVLLSAATQLEVRVSVAVDAVSAEGLAVHLFGAGDQELAQEVLNELSNIFMGTLKTALSAEAHPFTGGLPEVIAVDAVLRPITPFRFQETSMLMAGDARLVVFVGLRSRANILLTPPDLNEGMVLAKDVVSARGVLLLQGGTRLSENMVERLRSNLTTKHEIEVIAP